MTVVIALGLVGAALGQGDQTEPVRAKGIAAAAQATPSLLPQTTTTSSTTTTTSTSTTTTLPPTTVPPTTTTTPPTTMAPAAADPGPCHPSYDPCVPIASDVDCAGGSGNGPAYVDGPVEVVGPDVYDLDRNGDGWGCE